MTTLLITNDFPPRTGGIQKFVHNLAIRQPGDEIVVYCSDWRGSRSLSTSMNGPRCWQWRGACVPEL